MSNAILSILYVFHLILTIILQGKYYYHPILQMKKLKL